MALARIIFAIADRCPFFQGFTGRFGRREHGHQERSQQDGHTPSSHFLRVFGVTASLPPVTCTTPPPACKQVHTSSARAAPACTRATGEMQALHGVHGGVPASGAPASQDNQFYITGLTQRIELNGRTGRIERYDATRGRYIFTIDAEAEVKDDRQLDQIKLQLALRAANLVRFPLCMRRAWRNFHGKFDGDTDDEDDEYVPDAKRQKQAGGPRSFDSNVTLHPRAGPVVTVVATADLHRHHDEKYIAGDTLSLAEWFESDLSPGQIDVMLFAGDLGLEMACESTSSPHTTNVSTTLASWHKLLRRLLAAKPNMHVVIVGGNHDGLLCRDDDCLACAHYTRHGQADRAWPSHTYRDNMALMSDGLARERLHFLVDESVDVHLLSGEVVRIVGSPWTNYDTHGREHLSISHMWRPVGGGIFGGRNLGISEQRIDCEDWWRQHWATIGDLLDATTTADGEPIAASVLVTHSPPRGVLDIVGGTGDNPKTGATSSRTKRVGCEALQGMLEELKRPPLLHCFGHVHALQRAGEPPEGPRLAASKRVPGCIFANVAAERQLPEITGFRLSRKGAAAAADSGEVLALPAPGLAVGTALVPYMPPLTKQEWERKEPGLLMRPPTVLTLPLRGCACDCTSWEAFWEVKTTA